jgi:hypothetical protein
MKKALTFLVSAKKRLYYSIVNLSQAFKPAKPQNQGGILIRWPFFQHGFHGSGQFYNGSPVIFGTSTQQIP